MTNAQHVRASSRTLTVCSVILIIVGIPTMAHEVIGAIYGVTTSTAALAVSASCVSAFVGLVFFVWLARFAPSVLSWIAAFMWGTGGALIIAGIGNGVTDAAVQSTSLGGETTDVMTSVVSGPLIEETAKGIGALMLILAARRALRHPAQGAVLGGLVGLGFAWGEDIGYYVSALEDGTGGLGHAFLIRGVLGGFGHAIYTGVFAYFLAWALLRARNAFVEILAVCGGFVGAVLLHAQANGVGFLAPEDSWNLTYGAIELPVTAMAIALLVWGVRRRRATLEA